MVGFNAPTGPLKVAGLVTYKKPKAPSGPTAPIPNSGGVLGSLPNPTPIATTPSFKPLSVPDLLGNPSPTSTPPLVPSNAPSVSGLFSTPTVKNIAPAPQLAPDGHVLTPAELADRARAQGAGAGAAASLAANTAAGQQQQATQAGAMATASNVAALPASAPSPQLAPDGHVLTQAEIADRARAQGAAKGAADSLAANTAAGQQQQSTQANAMGNASAAAAKPASAPVPPPSPAAPAAPAAPAPGSPQADLETLRNAAINAMNAKDDPVAKREFNQAILQMGMANQAQRDALKMQIAQDPALNGQPAGTAVLMAAAQAAGAQVDSLIANLSVESAKRLQDLNQWGFDQLSSITNSRINQAASNRQELLAAGDYTGYAQAFKEATGMDVDVAALKALSPATQTAIDNLSAAMNRNVAAGNMDAAKQNFAAIQALSPQAFGSLTFNDVITAPDAYKAQSDQQASLWQSVRTQVASGQTASALSGLDAIFPDKAKQQSDGAALAASTDLATINAALKAAGMSPVSDKSELIGRGDDVFKAMQLASIAKEAGSTAIDKGVEMLQGELQKMGYDPTQPEEATALRSYVLNLQLNGGLTLDSSGNIQLDPNSLIPPWDPQSPDAHLFSDWPVLAADGTTVIDKGGDPYGTSNPKPPPDSARGQYYAGLDAKWEDYLAKTNPTGRLTRDQWFYATKAGTQAPDASLIPSGITPAAPDASDPLVFEDILKAVRAGKTLSSDQEAALIQSGRVATATPEYLATSAGSTAAAQAIANNETGGLFSMNGKIVRVLPEGGSYANHTYEDIGGIHARFYSWVKVSVGGKEYKVDNHGNWFAGNATLPTTTDGSNVNLPPTVPDPTKQATPLTNPTLSAFPGANTAGISASMFGAQLSPDAIKKLNGA